MIKYIEGDLFVGTANQTDFVISHVVNSMGAWGAGFVVPLGRVFPLAKESYLEWSKSSPSFELGESQMVKVSEERNVYVCNMAAQTLGGHRPLYYNHLVFCMEVLANKSKQLGISKIVGPMFGSALAGGNWDFIKELIDDCWIKEGFDVTIYYLPDNGFDPKKL